MGVLFRTPVLFFPAMRYTRVMGSQFKIRRATEKDAEAIARLSGALGYEAPVKVMRGRLKAILKSECDLAVVAVEAKGGVIGWLQAHENCVIESGFRVEIVGMIVSAEARRRGVGRALVAEAERWARERTVEGMVVRSNVKRLESHLFYPALGFIAGKTQTVYRKPLK